MSKRRGVRRRPIGRFGGALAVSWTIGTGSAQAEAQESGAGPPAAPPRENSAPPSTPPPPTAEEMKEIERALGADAKVQAAATPAPVETPARPATTVSLNPNISFLFDFALALFSQDENLQ